VTAFYSFRLYFLVFHGKERFRHEHESGIAQASPVDPHAHHSHEPHESEWVVTLPLILLAIASVGIGFVSIEYLLYGDFFDGAIYVDAGAHTAMQTLREEFHGPWAMAVHGLSQPPFWLAGAGVLAAYLFYIRKPEIAAALGALFPMPVLRRLLENKYYLDALNETVIARGARCLGQGLWKVGDIGLIDGLLVNGSARTVGWVSSNVRWVQTGHLYWYALVMILGVIALMTWQLWPHLSSLVSQYF
jgi:NADH-quinone oxidoreductase subunit L